MSDLKSHGSAGCVCKGESVSVAFSHNRLILATLGDFGRSFFTVLSISARA